MKHAVQQFPEFEEIKLKCHTFVRKISTNSFKKTRILKQ